VVLDHEDQEEPVELPTARGVELFQLILGEHARHQHLVVHPAHVHHHAVRIRLGHRLMPVAQPFLHRDDLVLLGVGDPVSERTNRRTGAVRLRPACHQQGLGVVGDHPIHELDIGPGVERRRSVRRSCGRGHCCTRRSSCARGRGGLLITALASARACSRSDRKEQWVLDGYSHRR